MPASKEEQTFVSHVVELMQSIGDVYAKRMFGGYGLFLDSLMFALVADSVLYLKVDSETEPAFTAKALEAFTYVKKEQTFKMSYFQAPEEPLEDSDEMNLWASKAYNTALRAKRKSRRPTKQ